MKLANPHDKRSMLQYKKSIARFSLLHAPGLNLRKRKRKNYTPEKEVFQASRVKRQTKNPYATKVGSSHG